MAETLTPEKIKDLLSDPKNRIELHDLVHQETEKLYKFISDMSVHNNGETAKKAKEWMGRVEEESKTLRSIFAYGCYFGTADQSYIWTRSLNRLGGVPHMNGLRIMLDLQLYPAMLIFYAGGISAIASGNNVSLKALFAATYTEPHHDSILLATKAHGWLLDQSEGNLILGMERRHTPLSDHVHDVVFADYPPSLIVKDNFSLEYDRWEVLLGMVVAHHLKDRTSGPWAPVGRFAWRRDDTGRTGLDIIAEEVELRKQNWPPLAAELFDGSVDNAKEAHKFVASVADRVAFF